MKIIQHGEWIASYYRGNNGEEVVTCGGNVDVDNDGSGPAQGDRYHQGDTSLRCNGKPLNALIDRFAVCPGILAKSVVGRVLGCLAYVILHGVVHRVVIGDIGPDLKFGEYSECLVDELGDDPNPVTGGSDDPDCILVFFPDIPATRIAQKDGTLADYQLQHLV